MSFLVHKFFLKFEIIECSAITFFISPFYYFLLLVSLSPSFPLNLYLFVCLCLSVSWSLRVSLYIYFPLFHSFVHPRNPSHFFFFSSVWISFFLFFIICLPRSNTDEENNLRWMSRWCHGCICHRSPSHRLVPSDSHLESSSSLLPRHPSSCSGIETIMSHPLFPPPRPAIFLPSLFSLLTLCGCALCRECQLVVIPPIWDSDIWE